MQINLFHSRLLIKGSDGSVYLLDSQITGQISDVIPSGDPAFNTSNNPLVISKTGDISEISIAANGSVTQTQLTTASAPLTAGNNPNGSVPLGSVAYNGTYLVGVAANFSGLVVYQKGTTAFRIVRDNFGGSYYSIFISPNNEMVWGSASSPKKVLNLTDLTLTDYAPSGARTTNGNTVYPVGMFGANGRYSSYVLSDRCMLWDTKLGGWMSLFNFPNNPAGTINDTLSGSDVSLVGNARYSYARISKNFAYCVATSSGNGVPNYFARYNIQNGTKIGVNLDNFGFLASGGYQVFEKNAFATITNTSNSDVQYVEINLETGAVTDRGVITVGTRKVTKLVPISGKRS